MLPFFRYFLLAAVMLLAAAPAMALDAADLLPGSGHAQPDVVHSHGFSGLTAQADAGQGAGQGMPSGFLGSMLTGQEFTGLNILDFIAMGVIIFAFARLMGSKRGDQERPPLDENSDAYKRARQIWGHYQDNPPTGPTRNQDQDMNKDQERSPGPAVVDVAAQEPPEAPPGPSEAATVPQGFDVREFMEGAKLVFARVQDSLSHGDLEDIGQFSTGSALKDFAARIDAQERPEPVDITRLGARLLEVKDEGQAREAAVAFDGVLNRRARGREAVREVWRFRKDLGDKDAMWLLEEVEPLQ